MIIIGIISVIDELDFERIKNHELIVRATDAITQIYAEVPVLIKVTDINDCYPILFQKYFNISLFENQPIGTPILTVNATDCDSTANSELSYEIEHSHTSSFFYIDEYNGSLILKSHLDYEEYTSHYLIVNVKDHGTPSLNSKVNIFINGRFQFHT